MMRRGRSIETLLNRGEFINGVREQRALSLSQSSRGNQSEKGSERSAIRPVNLQRKRFPRFSRKERERERVQIENRQSCFH